MRALALLLLGLLSVPAPAAPRRIVSLNLVSDILLINLVKHERIAALSHLARHHQLSLIHLPALSLPVTRGHAEQVVALRPDLVIGARWGQGPTLDLLHRLGIPTHTIPLAQDYAEITTLVRGLAQAVGEVERGEALIRRMEDLRAHSRATAPAPSRSALLFGAGGFSGGDHPLTAEILTDAGLTRAATGRRDLEQMILHPPDVVVAVSYQPGHPTLGGQLLDHPALRHRQPELRVVSLALLLNATHRSPEASIAIRDAAP